MKEPREDPSSILRDGGARAGSQHKIQGEEHTWIIPEMPQVGLDEACSSWDDGFVPAHGGVALERFKALPNLKHSGIPQPYPALWVLSLTRLLRAQN